MWFVFSLFLESILFVALKKRILFRKFAHFVLLCLIKKRSVYPFVCFWSLKHRKWSSLVSSPAFPSHNQIYTSSPVIRLLHSEKEESETAAWSLTPIVSLVNPKPRMGVWLKSAVQWIRKRGLEFGSTRRSGESETAARSLVQLVSPVVKDEVCSLSQSCCRSPQLLLEPHFLWLGMTSDASVFFQSDPICYISSLRQLRETDRLSAT